MVTNIARIVFTGLASIESANMFADYMRYIWNKISLPMLGTRCGPRGRGVETLTTTLAIITTESLRSLADAWVAPRTIAHTVSFDVGLVAVVVTPLIKHPKGQ